MLPTCLISADRIRGRIGRMGEEIAKDYAATGVDFVVVLRGAATFAADLARAIDPAVDVRMYYMTASSYEGPQSSGRVIHAGIPDGAGAQRPILLVEDIVDTGLTADTLLLAARQRSCAGVPPRIATLLDKPTRRAQNHKIVPDYVGFIIPDVFVVGYGLDDDQRLRHLGWVGVK